MSSLGTVNHELVSPTAASWSFVASEIDVMPQDEGHGGVDIALQGDLRLSRVTWLSEGVTRYVVRTAPDGWAEGAGVALCMIATNPPGGHHGSARVEIDADLDRPAKQALLEEIVTSAWLAMAPEELRRRRR